MRVGRRLDGRDGGRRHPGLDVLHLLLLLDAQLLLLLHLQLLVVLLLLQLLLL